MIVLFSLLLPIITAYLFLSWFLGEPDTANSLAFTGLKVGLAVGLGLGTASCVTFLSLLLFHSASAPGALRTDVSLYVLGSFLCLTLWFFRRKHHTNMPAFSGNSGVSQQWSRRLSIMFWLLFILANVTVLFSAMLQPHGGWDAWAIWNVRARYLLRAGDAWRNVFAPGYGWAHHDYPLLLSLNVVRLWAAAGHETILAPIVLAWCFTFGSVLLLAASVMLLRNWPQGLLAASMLLGAPFFLSHGVSQYADTPLGLYILGAIVCSVFQEHVPQKALHLSFLSGVLAGFAAWTKNEGLLFLLVFLGVQAVFAVFRTHRQRARKNLLACLSGASLVVLLVVYFKVRFAPVNDLAAGQNWEETFTRILDVQRYFLIIRHALVVMFSPHLLGLGGIILAVCLLLFKNADDISANSSLLRAGVVVIGMFGGYFAVYVVTYQPLAWHLGTSLNRLFLHLFPASVFVVFSIKNIIA